MGAHPLFSTLSRGWLNPIKLAYSPSPPDNGLGQYVSSPGNRAYCYAELAVSSLAMAVIIASTHFAYPRRDGQAELAWVKVIVNVDDTFKMTLTSKTADIGLLTFHTDT